MRCAIGAGVLVVHAKEVVGGEGVVVGEVGGEILTVASPQALAEV